MVKASELKNENPLEYVKALQNTVRRVPEAKGVIELLLNEMKNDEEKKRQEQIKNASPELVAMAEQLKVMLSAFSPDDPQLLAIKQSPLYKQVAFLIED
jgi:hypothetical protein